MRRDGQHERRGRRLRGDDGAAVVEFALCLPILALLVCGVIDLGRAYSAWNETKNAASEGAAYAQRHPNQPRPDPGDTACNNPNNIEYRVRQELPGTSAPTLTVIVKNPETDTVITACNNAAQKIESNHPVSVRVERSFDLITPIIGNIVGDPMTIGADVEVKVLG